MRLRRLKRNKIISPAFENELALEILKTDKLRVSILLCILGSVMPLMLWLAVSSYEDFQRFQSHLLISEMVWQSLGENHSEAIPMGHVQGQGREGGIEVYQLA